MNAIRLEPRDFTRNGTTKAVVDTVDAGGRVVYTGRVTADSAVSRRQYATPAAAALHGPRADPAVVAADAEEIDRQLMAMATMDLPEDTAGTVPPPRPAAEDEGDFPLTDAGNGERIAHEHGRHLRRVTQWKERITFAGGRWVVDKTGAADRMAVATVRRLKARGATLAKSGDDHEQAKGMRLLKYAHACESNRKLKDMLTRADAVAGMSVTPDDLDRAADLFNVANGTLDLLTLRLRPHDPADFLTKQSPVAFDPAATCPVFLSFLDRIFDGNADVIGFLQRAAGYTLTAHVGERVMFILYGSGSNGKSTLLAALDDVLADYATAVAAETLMAKQKNGIRNDIAKLKGARFVAASESNQDEQLDETLVKAMTGGTDLLTARFLYGEEFSFRPTFKVWLATNHKPQIKGTDPAIWDRIRLIPFNVRIPDEEKDKELPGKLAAEAAGILNWCLAGLAAWRAGGLGTPAEVADATAEYRADSDPLAAFIEECCVTGPDVYASATDLYTRFDIWAKLNGLKSMNQTQFGRELFGKGFAKERDSKTGRVSRLGIGLKSSAEQSEQFEAF